MPATPSEALLDVNLLIASVFADHPHHPTARDFVRDLQRFHTTPTTQGGFLRFATRPWRATGARQFPPRLTMAEAMAMLHQLTMSRRHTFTPDDVGYDGMDTRNLRGHRQWTDAYLVHLARLHGPVLATLDAAIESLDAPGGASVHVVR